MQKPVSILFTGQVREKEMFEQSLDGFATQPCVREIILSTWHSEALQHQAYLAGLRDRYGLQVVTVDDPALPFDRFNGLRQSVQLRRGLQAVSNAPYVFKTRSDCRIDTSVVGYLAQKDSAITDPVTRNMRIFRERVSVTAGSIYAPFYIDDKLLFGHRDDLRKLCSTDFPLYKYPSSAKFGHYVRFHPAFAQQFPQFDEFIRREILVTTSNAEFRDAFMPLLLQRHEYAVLLLAYYQIVANFFCMDWGGHVDHFRGSRAQLQDGTGPIDLTPDRLCNSNDFFRNAARGQFASRELEDVLGAPAAGIRSVADYRDVGNGIDYPGFWSAMLAEAKQVLRFDIHLNDAKRMLREQQVNDAFMHLNTLLPCDPYNTELRFLIGVCYDAVGDYRNAAIFLRSCLELGSSHESLAGQLLRQVESHLAAS